MKNPFAALSKKEWGLFLVSLLVVTLSYLCSSNRQWINLSASLIGVTALIFVSKGDVFGQVLTIVFSVFYGVISFRYQYYGEMLTYLGMTAPMALCAVISWIRHPYAGAQREVAVKRLSRPAIYFLGIGTIAVTLLFYFILGALGTANLMLSTVSVATSFAASYLTWQRSSYYALAYSANDCVLIGLWIFASMEDPGYLPMIFCFLMFLCNDLYGFFNWRRIQKRQESKG